MIMEYKPRQVNNMANSLPRKVKLTTIWIDGGVHIHFNLTFHPRSRMDYSRTHKSRY